MSASKLGYVARSGKVRRPRGSIRQRGNSFLVEVYGGIDPLTGKRVYLNGSTTNEAEAERIRTRLLSQVDEQRQARTKATLRTTIVEWLRVHEIEDSTREGYEAYLRLHIGPAIGKVPIGKVSAKLLEDFYAELRRCSVRCDGTPRVDHRVTGPHECRVVRHRYPPGRPPAGGYPDHDCAEAGCKVTECKPHTCKPMANSTILKIHYVISGALSAGQRWEWITSNSAEVAKRPRQPTPDPRPPTSDQAADIITAAWAEDATWGTLVWLVMVTGMRRAELLALRWSDIDLNRGTIVIRRNYVRAKGRSYEKDTKTHRMRRISLDPATVEVLIAHRGRYDEAMRQLDLEPSDEAFLFSYEAAHDRACDPSGVTHRYTRMCDRLNIDSHLHALRHYSATELLTAGVDLRTVAGRLGHAGGGATTLRVYAAWVGQSDRRAAVILGSRFKRPN